MLGDLFGLIFIRFHEGPILLATKEKLNISVNMHEGKQVSVLKNIPDINNMNHEVIILRFSRLELCV